MISTSTNELKVVFRNGLQLCRINVEQVFMPPVSKGQGAYCFTFVRPSVGLSAQT